jgi:Lon protease-like protein
MLGAVPPTAVTTEKKIPIFPLDTVLFPGAPLSLHIFEPRYKDMIRDCEATGHNPIFGVVYARREGLAVTGCVARIAHILKRYPDGRLDVLTHGEQRCEILALDESLSYLQAQVRLLDDDDGPAPRSLREQAVAAHFELLELAGETDPLPPIDLDRPITFHLVPSLPLSLPVQQAFLSLATDHERTTMLLRIYDELLPPLRAQAAPVEPVNTNGNGRKVH